MLKHPSLRVSQAFLVFTYHLSKIPCFTAWIDSYISESYHKSLWRCVNRFMTCVNRFTLVYLKNEWIVSSLSLTYPKLIHNVLNRINIHPGQFESTQNHLMRINLHSILPFSDYHIVVWIAFIDLSCFSSKVNLIRWIRFI